MDYPNNRLIVNGVDITETFKMVLADGYTLAPPNPKTYLVDIPGGNGKLDLTESLMGDTMYDNRSQEFTFYIIFSDNSDLFLTRQKFEKAKTEISNFLHGREFDYKLSMDPEYTYHGRFKVSSYQHSAYANATAGSIKISIDANPYKYKDLQSVEVDAVGGVTLYLNSGRKSVKPAIVSHGNLKVIHNGVLTVLKENGTFTITDLVFVNGENEIYLNSYDIHSLTWGELRDKPVTWKEFGTKKLYEWYKLNGNFSYVMETWEDIKDSTWNDLSLLRWVDLIKMETAPNDIDKAKIEYEWGDL